MTAMQELISFLDPIHSSIKDKAVELIEKEKDLIRKSMMYTLDEDGHSGEWKIKFIDNYIKKLYNK
jgi:hypothetical protein